MNHYICTIHRHEPTRRDKWAVADRPVWTEYFDGTERAALAHFKRQERVQRYLKQLGYLITVRSNPVTLSDTRNAG